MKAGLNLYSIRNKIQTEKDFLNTIKTLKKNGCAYIQFSGSPLPLNVVSKCIKKVKIDLVLTHSPMDRIINDTDNLMKEHALCHCKNIGLGMMPKEYCGNEKAFIKKAKELENAAKKMSKKGFKFFFHNHQFEFKHMKSGITYFEYMIKNCPHFNFTLDTYWVQYGGHDIISMVKKLKGRIECVHLKDYKIDDNLDPKFAPIGDGNIDFKSVIKEMKKSGAKYFLIEQDNAAELKNGFNDVLRSIKTLKEKF